MVRRTMDEKAAPDAKQTARLALNEVTGKDLFWAFVAFGPYDSRTLLKFPGLTLWLAAVRELNIPFLASVNAVYFAAGVYFASALIRAIHKVRNSRFFCLRSR